MTRKLIWSLLGAFELFMASGVFAEPMFTKVTQGQFQLTDLDGRTLLETDIIGHEIAVQLSQTQSYRARITNVIVDPFASDPLTLYDVEYWDETQASWEPLCGLGPHGMTLAAPLNGTWSTDGLFQPSLSGGFSLNCTSGAHVKCLRLGYAPWRNGESGARLHQACTRMIRADYCGTGQSFTLTGRQIQLFDRSHSISGELLERFEAVWGVDGAICIRTPRVEEKFPLQEIMSSCPDLSRILPDECNQDLLQTHPDALFANRF